jgi:hypothetical protein
MPEPIMLPMTSAVHIQNPSFLRVGPDSLVIVVGR